MWMASLASLVIWEGSLSMMLKSEMEGSGWWKSLQCLSVVEVVDLECSLPLLPRVLDISALFTSIPVPTALDVINCLFCEHIEDPEAKHKYGCSFKCNTIGLEKDEVMQLLKSVLENCVFTFQDKFFKQLHGATIGSPCSLVVANIYMEYFEDLALGPELPIPVKDWKRYMDDSASYPKATGTQCSNI